MTTPQDEETPDGRLAIFPGSFDPLTNGHVDIIYLDPPYAFARTREVLQAAAPLLQSDGLLVLERATRAEPDVPDPLVHVRDIRSGDSTLTLLVRRTEVL